MIRTSLVGIYKIVNPKNKVYIGQSWDIEFRKYQHSKIVSKTFISNSIKKHGWGNHSFDILHTLPKDCSQDILDNYEQIYLDAYRNSGHVVMNLKEAGSHGKLSESAKKKLSEAAVNKNKGIIRSEKTRLLMSMARTGKTASIETRSKQSLAKMGKKLSEGHKQKMKGRRNNYSPWSSGTGNQWKAKKVIDNKTGIIYDSIAKAAEYFSIKRRTLEARLSGQNVNNTTLSYYDTQSNNNQVKNNSTIAQTGAKIQDRVNR